ncbi:MAG: TVP38/TMEM64 family protein [Burkholderiales bacterium]|nr:TVP38/TMEM64 family protein [Burkholderiales bacterium]
MAQPSSKRRLASIAIWLLAATAIAGLGWWLARVDPSGLGGSAEQLVATLRGLGRWGIAASIGLMVLHSFVPFPAEILAVANGMVYGAALGALVTWTGAMLGAVSAFGLARRYGAPLVLRLLGAARSRELEHWALRRGTGALLVARLLPVVAFNLVNYGAALAGIGWRPFLWTTAIGIVPMTVLTAVLGHGLLDMPPRAWVAAGLGVLAAGIGWVWIRRRRAKRRP